MRAHALPSLKGKRETARSLAISTAVAHWKRVWLSFPLREQGWRSGVSTTTLPTSVLQHFPPAWTPVIGAPRSFSRRGFPLRKKQHFQIPILHGPLSKCCLGKQFAKTIAITSGGSSILNRSSFSSDPPSLWERSRTVSTTTWRLKENNLFIYKYGWSSRKRPPRKSEIVVVTRADCHHLREP